MKLMRQWVLKLSEPSSVNFAGGQAQKAGKLVWTEWNGSSHYGLLVTALSGMQLFSVGASTDNPTGTITAYQITIMAYQITTKSLSVKTKPVSFQTKSVSL